MLAAIMQSAGYKTGLFTSPHLKEFTERIKINGEEIAQSFVVDFVERMKPSLEKIKPSFFETTVALAFDYFAKQKVDIAVIEVGLGGRLDSTNVITPEVSLITNISWDHMDLLGDTLQKIAGEKAGIIKPNVPVVISERQQEVEDVFIQKALNEQSPIIFASDKFDIDELKIGHHKIGNEVYDLELELKGNYQEKNLAGVFAVVEELRKRNFSTHDRDVFNGLKNTIQLTGLKGRWQKLNDKPLMICDTGHNEAGIKLVVEQINQQKFDKLHFVIGMVKDKDISKVLMLFPEDAHYYFCNAKIPRAMPAVELKEKAKKFGLIGEAIEDVNEAINQANKNASVDDMIFIGGSTFVVGEIENL